MLLVVTGAAGFIASKVAEFLLAEGHTVIGIDDMNDSTDVRLKKWRVKKIRKGNVEYWISPMCGFNFCA